MNINNFSKWVWLKSKKQIKETNKKNLINAKCKPK